MQLLESPVMVCMASSPAWMVCEFISNARWVVIRSISELTGSTLDCSNEPCCVVPMPLAPGTPVCAVPEASVSWYRFSPIFSRPWGLMKLANWIVPACCSVWLVGTLIGNDACRS